MQRSTYTAKGLSGMTTMMTETTTVHSNNWLTAFHYSLLRRPRALAPTTRSMTAELAEAFVNKQVKWPARSFVPQPAARQQVNGMAKRAQNAWWSRELQHVPRQSHTITVIKHPG